MRINHNFNNFFETTMVAELLQTFFGINHNFQNFFKPTANIHHVLFTRQMLSLGTRFLSIRGKKVQACLIQAHGGKHAYNFCKDLLS